MFDTGPFAIAKTIVGTCYVFLIINVNDRVAIIFCFKCLRFI